jgi:hypothetical protein
MSNITKAISLEDLMAGEAALAGSRNSAAPTAEDLYDTAESSSYTKWRMPTNIRSVLVSSKVEPGRVASLSWSLPGDYKQNEKVYRMVGDVAQEVFPTDVIGILVDAEIRPSLRGNHGESTTDSVIGICRDGKCKRQLPNMNTGIFDTVYEFNESKDLRDTQPSKTLASLRWKPVTTQGLLEDVIRSGKSTSTITNKEGKEEVVSFDNRGMAYMYVTHVGVRVNIPSDTDGNPSIPKLMNKEEALANLITTERRVAKKVYKTYSTMKVYHMGELINENGEPLAPMFLALNMSNGAMRGHYKGGLASISKYLWSVLNCKGLKAPVHRALSEGETTILQGANGMGFYKRPSGWMTMMSLGMKEVQGGTFFSAPHFEGFDMFGSSLYEGKQHDTWGDSKNISSLNVTYLSSGLRDKVCYDPSSSKALALWDKGLAEAGFDAEPEEFTLASVISSSTQGEQNARPGFTDVTYTNVSPASAGSYFTEAVVDDDEDDLY